MNIERATFSKDLPGIDTITIDGKNHIFPWGFEFAGRDFFFSLSGAQRGIDKFDYTIKTINEKSWLTEANIQVNDVVFDLSILEVVDNNTITRELTLSASSEIEITGLAIRFIFSADFYSFAHIANQTIQHQNSGLYNMYPVENVELLGEAHRAVVSYGDRILPEGSKSFSYARDFNDNWIVHLRVLPDPDLRNTVRILRLPEKLVKYFDFIRIEHIANFIVKFDAIWSTLWHRPERTIGKSIPIGAYGLLKINEETKISLTTKVKFNSLEKTSATGNDE